MQSTTTLFYDVDTQRDFLLPDGKLYVPGAEQIIASLAILTRLAQQQHIRLAGSVDRHFSTDPELQANGGAYPEHCMDGSGGQLKIIETLPPHPVWIENRDYTPTELQALLQQRGEIYLEKQRFDVFVGNRNTSQVFDWLLRGITDVVVYGVVTEVCVDHAISGLKDRLVHLHVPRDAIAALSAKHGNETTEKWRRWGVQLTTVAEVVAELRR